MKSRYAALVAGLSAVIVSGCSGTSYQSSLEPKITSSNPLTASLQFSVGTANIATGTGEFLGLNTVESLRQTQSDIGASILTNAPTITGPSGFVVPAATDAYGDAGTNLISGTNQTDFENPPSPTTFNPMAGAAYLASSWGFLPASVSNSLTTPSLQPGAMPFYAAAVPPADGTVTPVQYIGGPPSYVIAGHTSTQDGAFPSGYPGFELGVVDFAATPTAGAYGLSVVVPTGTNLSSGVESYGTLTASSAIPAAPTVLAPWAVPPSFAPDGNGGGTITTNFAGDPNATEEFVELVDIGYATGQTTSTGALQFATGKCQGSGSAPYYYTYKVTPGTATIAVADDMGAQLSGKGAQPHTLCTAADNGGTADSFVVYGFAVDYPLFEAGFPASTGNATPTIVGAKGTDDITTSSVYTDPSLAGGASVKRISIFRKGGTIFR